MFCESLRFVRCAIRSAEHWGPVVFGGNEVRGVLLAATSGLTAKVCLRVHLILLTARLHD